MKDLYCVIRRKYRKFEKPKISYLLRKTFVVSITWIKCKNGDEKTLKEEDLIEILKILDLIENINLL